MPEEAVRQAVMTLYEIIATAFAILALIQLWGYPPESNILIVTHAFTIKTLLYSFAPERIEQNTKIQNAGIVKSLYSGGN